MSKISSCTIWFTYLQFTSEDLPVLLIVSFCQTMTEKHEINSELSSRTLGVHAIKGFWMVDLFFLGSPLFQCFSWSVLLLRDRQWEYFGFPFLVFLKLVKIHRLWPCLLQLVSGSSHHRTSLLVRCGSFWPKYTAFMVTLSTFYYLSYWVLDVYLGMFRHWSFIRRIVIIKHGKMNPLDQWYRFPSVCIAK